MNLVHEVKQGKGIDLASPGCRATDIDTSRRPLFTENDGATGEGLVVTEMPYSNSGDIGNGIKSFHLQAIVSGRQGGVNVFMNSLRRGEERHKLFVPNITSIRKKSTQYLGAMLLQPNKKISQLLFLQCS